MQKISLPRPRRVPCAQMIKECKSAHHFQCVAKPFIIFSVESELEGERDGQQKFEYMVRCVRVAVLCYGWGEWNWVILPTIWMHNNSIERNLMVFWKVIVVIVVDSTESVIPHHQWFSFQPKAWQMYFQFQSHKSRKTLILLMRYSLAWPDVSDLTKHFSQHHPSRIPCPHVHVAMKLISFVSTRFEISLICMETRPFNKFTQAKRMRFDCSKVISYGHFAQRVAVAFQLPSPPQQQPQLSVDCGLFIPHLIHVIWQV